MYFLIGISLLFGCFYAIHFIASLVSVAVWSMLKRRAASWPGKVRSDVLCALKVWPFAAAATFVFAFVLPSFVTFEPRASTESVGPKLTVVALLAAAGLIAGMTRIFASWWRTRRLIAAWLKDSHSVSIGGFDIPAHRIEHEFPVLAVVGVFRPRVFVAEKVLAELEAGELRASISHELGHIAAHDNLKRLAMRLCGDLLVFPFGRSLDRAWAEAAESAADESAAIGTTSLDLASALIKIGRLAPEGCSYKLPAGAYLLEPDDASLASRVKALLSMADRQTVVIDPRGLSSVLFYAAILFSITVATLSVNTAFLGFVHNLTEKTLAFLQ